MVLRKDYLPLKSASVCIGFYRKHVLRSTKMYSGKMQEAIRNNYIFIPLNEKVY